MGKKRIEKNKTRYYILKVGFWEERRGDISLGYTQQERRKIKQQQQRRRRKIQKTIGLMIKTTCTCITLFSTFL